MATGVGVMEGEAVTVGVAEQVGDDDKVIVTVGERLNVGE
jgi:hypothetical protein